MTNLIEKSLIIGFGILVLTIFSSMISPFLGKIIDFNRNEKKELKTYIDFIKEVDLSIKSAIQKPNKPQLKKIDYPKNFNISFYENFAEYEFILDSKFYTEILVYNQTFCTVFFHKILPQSYILNVSYNLSLIKIKLINSLNL